MKWTQADFEARALLEMLNYATKALQPNINKPKRHYRNLFTL